DRAHLPEQTEVLFPEPRLAGLEIYLSKRAEVFVPVLGDVLAAAEPEEARLRERSVAGPRQPRMFVAAHFVGHLIRVLHDVEAVVHDFVIGARDVIASRGEIARVHIHRDALDALFCVAREPFVIGLKALRPAPFLYRLDDRTIEVDNDRRVAMTLRNGFLVDAKRGQSRSLRRGFPLKPTRHRARHQMLSLVPAQAKDLRRPGDRGLTEHIDRERLEHEREPAPRLSPRDPRLQLAMLAAMDARDASVQPSLV